MVGRDHRLSGRGVVVWVVALQVALVALCGSPVASAATNSVAVVPFVPPSAGNLAGATVASLSCPATLWCGGSETVYNQNDDLLFSGSAGAWTATPAPLPSGAVSNLTAGSVSDVDCPAVGDCLATGDYFDTTKNTSQALVYGESNGTWQSYTPPPPASGALGGVLEVLSCPSTTWCEAGGYYYDSSRLEKPWAVTISSTGLTSSTVPLTSDAGSNAEADIDALSCAAVNVCLATARYSRSSSSSEFALESLAGGSWTASAPTAPPLLGSQQTVVALRCPTQTWCAYAGTYRDVSGYLHGYVETDDQGTTSPTDVPAPSDAPGGPIHNIQVTDLSCPASGWCEALGNYSYESVDGRTNGSNNEAATFASGQMTAVTLPTDPGYTNSWTYNVECPAIGLCTATGGSAQDSGGIPSNPLLLTLNDGAWSYRIPPVPNSSGGTATAGYEVGFGPVSCPASQWCSVGGGNGTSSQALILDVQYGGIQTAVSVGSSANPATVGVPVTYTATVTPTPDGGTVAFFDYYGDIPGCGAQPVSPATGTATCTQTYHAATGSGTAFDITASYLGDPAFAESGPAAPVTESVQPSTAPPPPPPPARCDRTLPSGTVVGMAVTSDGDGYWVASSTGTVAACGDAPVLGNGRPGTAAIASASDGTGYWLVTGAGTVQAFGNAANHGGLPAGAPLAKPIVAMAADPTTGGYWLLGGDGGVFSYDAPFYGSTGNIHLTRPAVGLEATLDGKGYRFVASDGGIFDYGDAHFYGSTGGIKLDQPVVGMADDPVTGGYWLDASDGGIFSFHAPFYGSTGNIRLASPCVGMTAMPSGNGYRFVAGDGGIFDFGHAPFEGSAA